MIITPSTRISVILKENPAAIEAIASISVHFNKLRNPLLRKILAPRVSIAEAAKMGKCTVADFFEKLKPLGFEAGAEEKAKGLAGPDAEVVNQHSFKEAGRPEKADLVLNVMPIINQGGDPLGLISEKVNTLKPGETLQLLTDFVPYPLIRLMESRGCQVFVEEGETISTFITSMGNASRADIDAVKDSFAFEDAMQRFEGKLKIINVRQLQMPQPMLSILAALETLKDGTALYVEHKKIPLMLLPELKDQGYSYLFSEDQNGILMLIYKP
jgi:uncharacterized protein (DUF2249 family)